MGDLLVLAEKRHGVSAGDVARRSAGLDAVCSRLSRRMSGRGAIRAGLAIGMLLGGGRVVEVDASGSVWVDGDCVDSAVLLAVGDRLAEVVHVAS